MAIACCALKNSLKTAASRIINHVKSRCQENKNARRRHCAVFLFANECMYINREIIIDPKEFYSLARLLKKINDCTAFA
jgi:hypothetical protein